MLKMTRVLLILTVVTFLVNVALALSPPPQPMCSATACQVGNCPCIARHFDINPNEACCAGFNCVPKMSGSKTIDVHGTCKAVPCAMKNERCGDDALDKRPCCIGLICSEIINPSTLAISLRCH